MTSGKFKLHSIISFSVPQKSINISNVTKNVTENIQKIFTICLRKLQKNQN